MLFGLIKSADRVKPAEVQDMLANKSDFVLLDVRSREEHVGGHIPGSELLPLDQLAAKASRSLPDKNRAIVVYCASGGRSAQAKNMLVSMGYANVRDMGGIMSWPYHVVRSH